MFPTTRLPRTLLHALDVAVEFATLEWVDWFNNGRLLEPIGYLPPADFEAAYYQRQNTPAMEAGLN